MVIINPGTETTKDYGWDEAYKNILQFIEDSEVELYVYNSKHIPEDDGRYLFTLKSKLIPKYEVEIEMPALPLNQVRFIDSEKQNVWDYPRLYVDGSSWVWKYAIIKKDIIKEVIEDKIDSLKYEIKELEKKIINL